MKVVFINRYFYPDHSATSQLLTDLAIYCAKSGIETRVITSRQVYDASREILPDRDVVNGVHVARIWTTHFGRQRLWGRTIDYATFYLSGFWRLLMTLGPGDIVVAKTDPPMISLVATMVARIQGATLINWIQDLFPEVAKALDVRGAGFCSGLLSYLRNRSLHAARCNVVIGERMAAKLVEEGVCRNKIAVVHNWADGEVIKPIHPKLNHLRQHWKLDNKFVVGYSGNFGRAHDFRTLLDAAKLLRKSSRVVFLFVGGGAQEVWLRSEVKEQELTNVFFKPYQPREQLAFSLSVPDLHIISLQPALEGFIVPSKFYGIAAAGRPILYIGDREGEVPKLLQESDCGFTVRPGSTEEAAELIRALANDQQTCRLFGERARTLFDRRFSKAHAEQAWEKILIQDRSVRPYH